MKPEENSPAPQLPQTPPDPKPTPEAPRAPAPDPDPVVGLGGAVEAMLRQPDRLRFHLRQPGGLHLAVTLMSIAVMAALGYGLVLGSFSGGTQWWAAPLKTVCGLAASVLICLPSLYIFACLGGSDARAAEIVGLAAGLAALLTVLLIGFAPVAWVFSQSTESLAMMGALHLAFLVIATGFALRFLGSAFKARGPQSGGITLWMGIFVIVMLQMTTALRPLVGTADTLLPVEKRFFLAHWGECIRAAATATSP